MSASLLLEVTRLAGIEAVQVPHPETGSPPSVLVTTRTRDDACTLAGPPAEVRRVLQAALAALDAADPAHGGQPAYQVPWPPHPTPQEVAP